MSDPVDKFQDGSIHVSIWENEGVKGAFRTASFQLRYKNSHNEWQTGSSYSVGDLKHLERATKEARGRIEAWQQQSKPTPKNAA
ncbi:MAG: hypothetical protein ACRD3O_00120 [Terriglobia bacterium]